MLKKAISKLSKTQLIASGFFIIILLGAFLLMLPISSRDGNWTSFTNAFFTATSATCVTGLIVADTCLNWTVFGQIVIIILIQLGGLGFMTIAIFFSVMLRKKIGLKEREILHESVNTINTAGVVRLVKKIIMGTAIFEGIGAVVLSACFVPEFGWIKGIYYGIFHSISAFCNAGFDLMGSKQPYSSLTSYYNNIPVNITIMLLIIIGGMGFLVWDDISKNKLKFKKYMLQSKLVISVTALLIVGGAILFFIFERNNLLADMPIKGKILSSLFSSVTPRTAGFNTIDTATLTESSHLLTIILMFVGGSPGSTAGGIKTTTMAVIVFSIAALFKKTKGCNAFGRRFEEDAIRKASIVFFINLFLAVGAALVICSLQQKLPLADVMFETFSAIGTVGMSTGLTRELTVLSKYIIAALMFAGRIGSLSFALSFVNNKRAQLVQKPIEKITIG